MKRISLLLVVLSILITSNALALYDVPSDRRVVWSTGLDPLGGIPNYVSVTCSGLDPTGVANAAPQINTCINNASPSTAVYIPAGTYNIGSDISLKSNVALRGAGAGPPWLPSTSSGTTTFVMNGNKVAFYGGSKMNNWSPGAGSGTDITSGYTKGSTSITLSDASNYAVGNYISIFQDTDSSIISTKGFGWLGEDYGSGDAHVKQQYSKITAKNGNVLTIDPPIYYVTPNPTGAQVRKQTFGIAMAGIESIKLLGNGTQWHIIHFEFARHCWAKGVETYNAGNHSGYTHIKGDFSYGLEIRDSYVHTGGGHDSGMNYGINFYWWNSGHKIENNIVRDTRHSIIFEGGGSGCFIGYNYTNDNWESVQGYPTNPDTGFLSEDVGGNHGAHPHMNLFEGNIATDMWFDYTQGSSSHGTLFRNNLTGKRDSPAVTNPWLAVALEIEYYNRYFNIIGNVIGNPAMTTGTLICNSSPCGPDPKLMRFGFASAGGAYTDNLSYSTAIKHGNYDYVTNSVVHWDGGVDHNLPNSMYYGAKPTWWCQETSWPPIGPDVIGLTNNIPAKRRYDGATCSSPSQIKYPSAPANIRIH